MKLTPKNWGEFQHYRDRSPTWIKLHKHILDDYEFQCLPVASRALAPMLWLIASECENGQIDASVEKLAFRLRMSEADLTDALKALIDGGFFILEHDASAPLAEPERDASLEKRREEREKEERESGASAPDGVRPPSPKLDFSSWPEQPKPETLKDWIAHRKRKQSPVSQTVINRLSGKLAACVAKGYSVDDCLAESVTRGWLGLELEWLENAGVKPSRRAAEVKSRDDPLMAAKREAQDLHSRIKADRDLGLDPPADSVARLDELKKFIKGFGRGS